MSSRNEDSKAAKEMWEKADKEIDAIDPEKEPWNKPSLPLARVKKIMKLEEINMQESLLEQMEAEGSYEPGVTPKPPFKFFITEDAPLLMAKACELFIQDLTVRANEHVEQNKRRTMQPSDLHSAVGQNEVFDFLIDLVPRVELPPTSVKVEEAAAAAAASMKQQQQAQQQSEEDEEEESVTDEV